MLVQLNGKWAVAALGTLLAGSTMGWVPVGRFVGPRTPPPRPRPICPVEPICKLPTPVPASRAQTRLGPLGIEALLSQSHVAMGDELAIDVKLAADTVAESGERRPIDFALVLDCSGSMADANKIGLMKQACLGLADQLGPKDHVSLVSFSTDARTVFSLQTLDRARFEQAVRGLVARGGTNISAGLELGAAELRKAVSPGSARRLLLLTDGQPNAGEQSPDGLRGIARRLEQQGVSVSTVGLGLDYNAKLLSDMAEAGGGSYSYVDSAERIAGIYDAELRSLRTLVAKGVKVRLTPVQGLRLDDVIEWRGERDGESVVVNAGDFESGRATKIVARLRVLPAWRALGTCGLLDVTVTADDARTSAHLSSAALRLGATFTDDAALAARSILPEARKDLDDARVGELLETARASAEKGDTTAAKDAFTKLKAMRPSVSYTARDGKVERLSVQELENAYESGDLEQHQKANMFSRSAAAAAAKR